MTDIRLSDINRPGGREEFIKFNTLDKALATRNRDTRFGIELS